MKHLPRSSVMLLCKGRIISGKETIHFSKPTCDKILRPYFATKYNLSLEDSINLKIIKI